MWGCYMPDAKHAAERSLAALYQPTYGSSTLQGHNHRVLSGYRATLANPNVSDAAKADAGPLSYSHALGFS